MWASQSHSIGVLDSPQLFAQFMMWFSVVVENVPAMLGLSKNEVFSSFPLKGCSTSACLPCS